MGAGLSANAKQALANCKKEGKTELNFSNCNISKIKNFRPILKLKQLTYLNLEHNLIDELPNNMEKLVFLKQINLKDNKLVELGNGFLVMCELTRLNVSMNQLSFLPGPISNLRALTRLDIGYNNIKELPADFGKLSLRYFNMSGNKLKVVPMQVWECSTIEELHLHHNQLTVLQPEVKNLNKLRVLDVSFNELEEVSGVVGSLERLQELFVNDNRLSNLPAELTQLKLLETLSAGCNRIASLDALVPNMANFENLLELNLSENQLTSLPAELGYLPKLKVLDASKNQLTEVPKQIGWLDKTLRKLFLQNNKIEQLPGDLSFLNPALKLDLNANPLDTDVQFNYNKGTPILLESLKGLVRAYPEHCVAYGDALVSGKAGKGECFKIKAFDKFKKEVKGSKDVFTCTMTLVDPAPKEGSPEAEPYNCHLKNHKNGEHSVFYNVRFTGLYKTAVLNDGIHILGSPFDTVIEPGDASAEHSTAAGRGLIDQPAGSSTSFKIITRDRFENELVTGGAEINVRVEGGSAPVPQVVDNNDGTYEVSYVLGWADTYRVYCSINGKDMLDSPWTLNATE